MIPLNVNLAVNLFSQPQGITAYDEVASLVNHEFEKVEGDDYTVNGKIAIATSRDTDILSQGDIASGAIAIHTIGTPLYFYDVSEATGEVNVQTFVRFVGQIWRVKSDSDRSNDGAYLRYGAVKYLER